jgi:hypothetical protein
MEEINDRPQGLYQRFRFSLIEGARVDEELFPAPKSNGMDAIFESTIFHGAEA